METSSAVGPALDLVCLVVLNTFSHSSTLVLSWLKAWASKAAEMETSSAVGPALDLVCFAVLHVFSHCPALGLSWPSAWTSKAAGLETLSLIHISEPTRPY